MILTRAQILKKFGLRPRTLDVLLGTRQLSGTFKSKQGKRVISLSAKDVFVLGCARNSIFSFGSGSVSKGKVKGIRALPFHRFLCLRFITCPIDEVYDEIFQHGILRSSAQYPLKALKETYKKFLSFVPKDLKTYVQKSTYPKKKDHIKKFELLLRALDILPFYEHPELIDQLSFYFRMRVELEALMTTEAQSDEISAYVEKLSGLKIGELAISSYRRMFYALHDMEPEDIEAYLILIPPSERRAKREAVGKTLSELSVMKGVSELVETREILEIIKKESIRDFFNQREVRSPQALQAARAALDQFLKAEERLERLGGNSAEIAMIFERFIVRKQAHGDIVKIDDIRQRQIAENR